MRTKKQKASAAKYKKGSPKVYEKEMRKAAMPTSSWWTSGDVGKKAKEEEQRMRRSPLGRSPFERLPG